MARRPIHRLPERLIQAFCAGAFLIGGVLQPGVACAQSILDRVLHDIDRRAPDTAGPELFLNMAEHSAVQDEGGSILNRVDGSVRLFGEAPDLAAGAAAFAPGPAPAVQVVVPNMGAVSGHAQVATVVAASNNTGMIDVAREGAARIGGYSATLGNIASTGTDVLGAILQVGQGGAEALQGKMATSSIGSVNTGGITIRINDILQGVRQ